jgi:hypothetical protein
MGCRARRGACCSLHVVCGRRWPREAQGARGTGPACAAGRGRRVGSVCPRARACVRSYRLGDRDEEGRARYVDALDVVDRQDRVLRADLVKKPVVPRREVAAAGAGAEVPCRAGSVLPTALLWPVLLQRRTWLGTARWRQPSCMAYVRAL